MGYDRRIVDLAEPFPNEFIHGNPSGGGTYVKHHVVEQRLIQVFGIPPRFEMVEVIRGDVAAIAPNPNGRSQRAKDGSPALSNVVVGVIARLTVHMDGRELVVEEAGDCEEPHNWKTDGARLKDAMSDAYKRCAMRLGCGLHLWSQDEYFLHRELLKDQAGTPTSVPQATSAAAAASPSATAPAVVSPPAAKEGGTDSAPVPSSSGSDPFTLIEQAVTAGITIKGKRATVGNFVLTARKLANADPKTYDAPPVTDDETDAGQWWVLQNTSDKLLAAVVDYTELDKIVNAGKQASLA